MELLTFTWLDNTPSQITSIGTTVFNLDTSTGSRVNSGESGIPFVSQSNQGLNSIACSSTLQDAITSNTVLEQLNLSTAEMDSLFPSSFEFHIMFGLDVRRIVIQLFTNG